MEAIRFLQGQAEEDKEEEAEDFGEVDPLQQFDFVLRAIVAVVNGDDSQRGDIEKLLDDLETKGWHLKGAVVRIWAGAAGCGGFDGGVG